MISQLDAAQKEGADPITYQDMKNILQFLKDNNITASVEQGTPIAQLMEPFSPEELELVGVG